MLLKVALSTLPQGSATRVEANQLNTDRSVLTWFIAQTTGSSPKHQYHSYPSRTGTAAYAGDGTRLQTPHFPLNPFKRYGAIMIPPHS